MESGWAVTKGQFLTLNYLKKLIRRQKWRPISGRSGATPPRAALRCDRDGARETVPMGAIRSDGSRIRRMAQDDFADPLGPLLVGEMTSVADHLDNGAGNFSGDDLRVARRDRLVVLADDQDGSNL